MSHREVMVEINTNSVRVQTTGLVDVPDRIIGAFVEHLRQVGYGPATVAESTRTVARFRTWAKDRGIPVRNWDERAVEQFRRHRSKGCLPASTVGLHRVIHYLRQIGAIPKPRDPPLLRFKRGALLDRLRYGAFGRFVDGFASYVGKRVSPRTVVDYLLGAARFSRWAQAQQVNVRKWDEPTVDRFLREAKGALGAPHPCRGSSVAARHLIDYLRQIGAVRTAERRSAALDFYLKHRFFLERYRAGVLARFMDGFAAAQREAGYNFWTVRGCLSAAARFGHWAQAHQVAVRKWDESTVDRFCRDGGDDASLPKGTRGKVLRFTSYLRSVGAVPTPRSRSPWPPVVMSFAAWLGEHRGVGPGTVKLYSSLAGALLQDCRGRVERLDARRLRDFVLRRAAQRGSNLAAQSVNALRAFTRFLIAHGKIAPELQSALPNIRRWKLASLPGYLSAGEVARVIQASESSGRARVRDRAIVLLLARLGLRAGDVAGLRLSDLDWDDGTFTVMGKTRRQSRLPLPQEVGDAILAYLKTARPPTRSDWLFLSCFAPTRRLTAPAVSLVASRAIARAGVITARSGAHVLRFTAATQMLREGVPLEEIGSVLRHQSIAVTGHYAKVDVNLLRTVAQRWPEASC